MSNKHWNYQFSLSPYPFVRFRGAAKVLQYRYNKAYSVDSIVKTY